MDNQILENLREIREITYIVEYAVENFKHKGGFVKEAWFEYIHNKQEEILPLFRDMAKIQQTIESYKSLDAEQKTALDTTNTTTMSILQTALEH